MRRSVLLILLMGCAHDPASNVDAPQVLADHGESDYTIIIPAEASEVQRYAASEFQRLFKEVSGVLLPIASDATRERPHEIRIDARESATPLGTRGYQMHAQKDHVAILGGPLVGVYAFFERFLDCRWFTREVVRVPKRDRVEVPPFTLSQLSPFEYREVFYTEAFDGDFAARIHSNGNGARLEAKHGGKLIYHPFVHTFYPILPPEKYFKDHPEYYAEVNGKRVSQNAQLCLTNPEVLRLTVECVQGWIREHPEAAIYSVSQNDCLNNCQCAKCKAIDEREGSPSGSLLEFVNKVAEAIEKEHPDKLIDTLAYQYTRHAPKTVRPRANVRVRLCSIECCFSHPLDSCPQNKTFLEDLIAWSKISDNLYVWDYVTDFSHYLLPFPNLDVLGPNARTFAKHGVVGIFEEGNYSAGGGGELSDLRTYLLGQILWDPWTDVSAHVREFTEAVYGGAAPQVRAYLDLLRERAAKVHVNIRARPDAAYLAGDFLDRAERLFDEGAAALKDRPEFLKRLRKARLPLDYLRMARGKMKRTEFKSLCAEFGITEIAEGTGVESLK